jgi:hypothetical protein
MTAIAKTEEKAMAISFPAPEAAVQERLEREAAEHAQGPSLVAQVATGLKRGYERMCSTIFDPDGDCMRF